MIVKLKSPTIHALRILKCMAGEELEYAIGSEICKQVEVTHSYFMRIAKDLRSAGLLESIQGRNGGFALSRDLEHISLYEVIMAMEGEAGAMDERELSKLGDFVKGINEQIEEQLRDTSVADLLKS